MGVPNGGAFDRAGLTPAAGACEATSVPEPLSPKTCPVAPSPPRAGKRARCGSLERSPTPPQSPPAWNSTTDGGPATPRPTSDSCRSGRIPTRSSAASSPPTRPKPAPRIGRFGRHGSRPVSLAMKFDPPLAETSRGEPHLVTGCLLSTLTMGRVIDKSTDTRRFQTIRRTTSGVAEPESGASR